MFFKYLVQISKALYVIQQYRFADGTHQNIFEGVKFYGLLLKPGQQ